MAPARRTALVSVVAAAFLIALKLGVGLATNSLGFLSEALHSGTDLVAALLTFFAIGVAHRPADATHAYGHGKAEHLSALAECVVLAIASIVIGAAAIRRLASDAPPEVSATWWAFATLGVVIAIDLSRVVVSRRGARRHDSPALAANALHFAGDLAGTTAVVIGLALTRAGVESADAVAALFVGALVLVAATRLARVNVDVLMDRTPAEAERRARDAIERLGPQIGLRRLRMREAGGRYFADAVIVLAPGAALTEGHAAADAVETAVREELPDADVVVHVEPDRDPGAALTERALGAATSVPGVREVHNIRIYTTSGATDLALHLKLPAQTPIGEAHSVAHRVESAIRAECPELRNVDTHIEPLDEPRRAGSTHAPDLDGQIRRTVADLTGAPPRRVRFTDTEDGLVAFIDVGVAADSTLAQAHEISGTIRSRLRRELDGLDDVQIHTEPMGGDGQ